VKTIDGVTIDIEQLDEDTVRTSVRNDGAVVLSVIAPVPSAFIQVDGDCVRFARIRFEKPEVRAHYFASPSIRLDRLNPTETLQDTFSLKELEESDEALARKLREENDYKASKDARETVTVTKARFVVETRRPKVDDYQLGWKEIVLARPVEVLAYRRGWW